MSHLKRIVSIQDISGFGKCSLTVTLPIVSAMGVEVNVVPTSVLSTHTGIKGYTYRDLTQDIIPFINHWKSIGIKFDAIHSGFLGSCEQVDAVIDSFSNLKSKDNLIVVDPVMADNGEIYKSLSYDIVNKMYNLCKKADIILPNITEALLILGREYRKGPYDKSFIEELLIELSKIGPKKIAITGLNFSDDKIGVAIYDSNKNIFDYTIRKKVNVHYPGAGDIFCSCFLGALLNNIDFKAAIQIAVDFTTSSIMRTSAQKTNPNYGINFEEGLPNLMKHLNNKS